LQAAPKVIVCGRDDWTLAPAQQAISRGPTISAAMIGKG
jgi:hypothetical protein